MVCRNSIYYLHEVHDHVELLRGLEGIVQTHNEGMAHVGQNRTLRLRALHLQEKIFARTERQSQCD